jgi:hypothetical protein
MPKYICGCKSMIVRARQRILSQLPDAPTEDPKDIEDVQEPSPKKQKTEEMDGDFVVIEKEDAAEDKRKAEL